VYQQRYLNIAECGTRVARPAPALRKPVRKDHNAGGKSTWMEGFFDRLNPPLWKAIGEWNPFWCAGQARRSSRCMAQSLRSGVSPKALSSRKALLGDRLRLPRVLIAVRGPAPTASGANSVASALGSLATRDPGKTVRTYHEGFQSTLKIGTFYFGPTSFGCRWTRHVCPSSTGASGRGFTQSSFASSREGVASASNNRRLRARRRDLMQPEGHPFASP